MIEAMGALAIRLEQQHGIRLTIRIGIHTGPVVVGEMGAGGRHEQLALGETPNIAARLESLAAPNTMVISAALHHLVQGYFVCDDLGTPALKGVDTPFQVYRVVSESGAQSRLDVVSLRGLTPLVGREAEVTLLLERWAQVKDGMGQVVLLSGEAGIGKSRLVTVRILTLYTFRPQFTPPWPLRSHIAQLTLTRLPRPQVARMVTAVAGGKALPTEVVQQLVTRSDGVPLFVEEMTKLVLESGLLREHEDHYGLTGRLPPLAVPPTLQDALMARLDQLASAKVVAQLGATIGREFTYELLRAVSPMDDLELWRGLVQLVQAGVLYQRGALPQATYLFKHALIQEAAYQSLLRSTRQQFHQQIAQVLAAQFPDLAETQPELLAQHYTEAGLTEPAVGYWQRAADRSNALSAYMEMVAYCNKGLDVLQTLPDTVERAQRELVLQLTLSRALAYTQGHATPETGRTLVRARELGQQVGTPSQLLGALVGLHEFYNQQAKHQTAHALAEQLLNLAQRQRDPARLMTGHRRMGTSLFWLGELSAARAHLEQAIALNPKLLLAAVNGGVRGSPDPGSWQFAAMVLWLLGYPEQAMERTHESLTVARELAQAHTLSVALFWAAWLHQYRREGPLTQERAEACLALATEHGLAPNVALGTILRGGALAAQGQGEIGIAHLRQGVAAWRAAGSEVGLTNFLAFLAEAYGYAGQTTEGLHVLAEALAFAHATGERSWEAELYRLKGEQLLTLPPSSPTTPEECFCQALEIARRQQAKSLELRAAMSLSRLWQRQGKRAEGRELLAPIYGWFTEGFDTADLQDARALLVELGG
jgi:tetratricopeptide (TPR) repeat protein